MELTDKDQKSSQTSLGTKVFFSKETFLSFVLLVISLVLTFFVWRWTSQSVEERARDKFELESSQIMDLTEDRLNLYINALTGAQALFAASKEVDRGEWSDYIKKLEPRKNYPGFVAMRYIEKVADADKAAFAKKVKADRSLHQEGYPVFEVHPEVKGPEHFIVTYVEPEAGNGKMLGLDLGWESARLEALEKARDSGKPTATGPTNLVTDKKEELSFLMVLPIYKNGVSITTVEERRVALVGFVDGAFRLKNLFENVFVGHEHPQVDFDVFDTTKTPIKSEDNFLYSDDEGKYSSDPDYNPRFSKAEELKVGSRNWTMRTTTLPGFGLSSIQEIAPAMTLAALVIISLLFSSLVYVLLSSRKKSQSQADRATADLQKFKLAVENAPDHIIISDPEGKILYANKAATKTTGYSQEELIGASTKLWGGQMPKEFYNAMWKAITQDKKIFSGEVTNKRKGGKKYEALISIAPILNGEVEIIGFVGIEVDITEKKKSETELAKRTQEAERLTKLMVGRELTMTDMKKELGKFKAQAGDKKETSP